jgi:hypothetical protein
VLRAREAGVLTSDGEAGACCLESLFDQERLAVEGLFAFIRSEPLVGAV